METANKDVLIAYLPSANDLKILHKNKWYRIPVDKRIVPQMIKNRTVKLIAFYQPRIFEKDAFSVRYYGKVKRIEIKKRKYLFPKEPLNEKSENKYYKIFIDKLYRLPRAIKSLRHRRILFISTTFDRFNKAYEINDLFYESTLEEILWEQFKQDKLLAERQFLETVKNNNFILDFAVFCKKRNINIECDGDKYHTKKQDVQKDKKRDNLLESMGWSVLRYTTYDLTQNLNDTVRQVKDTINKYGGIDNPSDYSKYHYYPKDFKENTLFD